MKLRISAIAAALSVIPIAQPLLIGTGGALTSAALILSAPERVNADDDFIKNAYLNMQKAIPDSADFYMWRGIIKDDQEDYRGAISDFTKAIERYPLSYRLYSWRGSAAVGAGECPSCAISDLNRAIQLNSRDSGSHFYKGMALQQIGDKKGACNSWRKALSLGHKYSSVAIKMWCPGGVHYDY